MTCNTRHIPDAGIAPELEIYSATAPLTSLAGGVFAGEKADAKQRFEIDLDQRLQRLFEIGGIALQLVGSALGEAE